MEDDTSLNFSNESIKMYPNYARLNWEIKLVELSVPFREGERNE